MNNQHKQAKVTLVGAGPGDIDLISVAGLKALQSADVILYDALVNPELLDYAPNAKKVFVGKRKGYKRFPQEEINYKMVAYAYKYGHVVRLKGGDAFIFGRGAEEIDFIQCFGVPTKVIPGISSSTSVPAALGIPLTKRGVSQSFWVLTGTTKNRTLSNDIQLAAQSTATVVILMGMTHLPQIAKIYQQLGKGNSPIAIIQNGYRDNQKSVIANMDTIVEEVKRHQLSHPAIIVIGPVVGHASNVSEILSKPEILAQFIAKV